MAYAARLRDCHSICGAVHDMTSEVAPPSFSFFLKRIPAVERCNEVITNTRMSDLNHVSERRGVVFDLCANPFQALVDVYKDPLQ